MRREYAQARGREGAAVQEGFDLQANAEARSVQREEQPRLWDQVKHQDRGQAKEQGRVPRATVLVSWARRAPVQL